MCCALQFPYKVDVPLVHLLVEDEWNSVDDAVATEEDVGMETRECRMRCDLFRCF